MKLKTMLVILNLTVAVRSSPAINSTYRDDKLFLVVNPKACEDGDRSGACLPYFSCEKNSGTVNGLCSLGLGECCIFDQSCGGSSSARVSYFTSDASDATDQGTCTLSINKAPNTCQLRLDMTELDLEEPNEEGECDKQYLEVEDASGYSPKICGINDGQHLYVDISNAEGPFKVKVVNMGSDYPSSNWDIEVEQIQCDSSDLAPAGCSQYFTELTGEVKSFNYDTTASTKVQTIPLTPPETYPGSRHLQETYTICVRQETDYCSIKWTADTDDDHPFTLSGPFGQTIGGVTVPNEAGVDSDCITDYLFIPRSEIPGETGTFSSICGLAFPESVTSTSFRVTMVANSKEGEDVDFDNRGFHLEYEQEKCP